MTTYCKAPGCWHIADKPAKVFGRNGTQTICGLPTLSKPTIKRSSLEPICADCQNVDPAKAAKRVAKLIDKDNALSAKTNQAAQ